MLPKSYYVLDFETTGIDAAVDNIIEIGLLYVKDGEVKEYASELANPGHPLTEKIVEITHITDEMLMGKRKPIDVMSQFLTKLESDNEFIVGHNIVRFDRLFCDKYSHLLKRKPLAYERFIDTAALFKQYRICHTQGHKNYNLPNGPQHLARWADGLLEQFTFKDDKVKYNLTAATNYLAVQQFGINKIAPNRHRALYDCVLTSRVLEALRIEMNL